MCGPVATQATAEIGNPGEVTFVFGHTHKPFVEERTMATFSSPVAVVNTGGWVVDAPQLSPLKGASLVLIDDQLNVASVRCYTEGPDASSYRVRVDPSNSTGANELADQLRAARTAVGDRGRQLADRLQADASTLNRLNRAADDDADTTGN